MVEIAPPAAALYPGGPVKPVPMVQQGYPTMPKPAAAAIVITIVII